MAQPHKHAEVIKAWADGAQIQIKERGEWVDYPTDRRPLWVSRMEYRVKPEAIRYRVALGVKGPITVKTNDYAVLLEHSPGFKRWLTDWTEVEVG